VVRRKFAVIKLWPNVKAAEDEVIARLQIAARSLDIECLIVDSFARLFYPPYTQLSRSDVDFVLSLHFETPKRFDIFSFVTLWNPLQFYYDWGYRKYTRHLLTHDDFLSSASASGDAQVLRFIANDPKREGPRFQLFPTLSGPILEPSLGDGKLFYAGINWERLTKKPGRHEDLMVLLDKSGDLRIYGPKIYSGVDVWEGYKSYSGPIPFDGVSVVRLIHEAGVSLVLSSAAHRQAEMMSCRIFESAAAGAVIICEENAFARRHFGDSLLYIDTTLTPEETYGQVQSHLAWIKSEPDKALAMAKQAQGIFRQNFGLDTCLSRIYEGLDARKEQLERLYTPRRQETICVVFLMPEFRTEVLERHIASCLAQRNVNIRGVLAMSDRDADIFGQRVRCRLASSGAPLEVAALHFADHRPDGSLKGRRTAGEVLTQVLESLTGEDYACIVASHESLFADHLASLLCTLQDSEEVDCAWSDMLTTQGTDRESRAELCDDPDPGDAAGDTPIRCGRFLFRVSALEMHLKTALPYLDALAMQLLFGSCKSAPSRRCTLVSLGTEGAAEPKALVPVALEREILIDYSPEVFGTKATREIVERLPQRATAQALLEGMTPEERTKLAVELAHAVPLPAVMKKMVFGVYRMWLRLRNSRSHADSNNGANR